MPKDTTFEDLSPYDRRAVQEFQQFIRWAGPVIATRAQAPLRHLAYYWYDGLMTMEEGQRIEQGQQIWQEVSA